MDEQRRCGFCGGRMVPSGPEGWTACPKCTPKLMSASRSAVEQERQRIRGAVEVLRETDDTDKASRWHNETLDDVLSVIDGKVEPESEPRREVIHEWEFNRLVVEHGTCPQLFRRIYRESLLLPGEWHRGHETQLTEAEWADLCEYVRKNG